LVRACSMEKNRRTREQLEELVLMELRKVPECEWVGSVAVQCTEADGYNWEVNWLRSRDVDGGSCRRALSVIVPRLQVRYELIE
jgi:hypothetical protein